MPFGRKPKEFPDHLWTKCPTCGEMLFNKQLVRNLNVCSKCEHHFRLGARPRIEQLVDKGSFVEQDSDLVSGDPLRFVDSKPYPDRIAVRRSQPGRPGGGRAGPLAAPRGAAGARPAPHAVPAHPGSQRAHSAW